MPRTLTAGTVIRSYSPRERAWYRLSIEALLTPTSQAAFQISQRAAAAVSASPKTAVCASLSMSSSRRRSGLVTVTPPFASCNAPRTASNISETLAYFIANGSSCASSSARNDHFIAGDEGARALLHWPSHAEVLLARRGDGAAADDQADPRADHHSACPPGADRA